MTIDMNKMLTAAERSQRRTDLIRVATPIAAALMAPNEWNVETADHVVSIAMDVATRLLAAIDAEVDK